MAIFAVGPIFGDFFTIFADFLARVIYGSIKSLLLGRLEGPEAERGKGILPGKNVSI